MRFAKNIYLGEGARKNAQITKWKLRFGVGMIGAYCVAIPEYGDDPLEIFHNSVLRQKYYRKKSQLIVGLAEGFEEAALLSAKIMADSYKENGNYNVREYFKKMGEKSV